MSRPWKKQWPRIGANGKKSYVVGYRDHEKVERSKTFATASGEGGARDWMREYSAAERRGQASLERFLRDLDAVEANATDGRPFGQIVALYFALDADPALEGGLAQATFHGYKATANPHLLGRPFHNPASARAAAASFPPPPPYPPPPPAAGAY